MGVPIPKVKAMTEDEMFKVLRTGKRKTKAWKRVINKASFVGDNFTRKNPKYERFIRPSALRYKKAHVTHPELKQTFHLDIVGVKKNPRATCTRRSGSSPSPPSSRSTSRSSAWSRRPGRSCGRSTPR